MSCRSIDAPLDQLSEDWIAPEAKVDWLRRVSTRWLLAEHTLESVARSLDGTSAVVIKGCAVGPLDYPVRELRDLTDVDLLIDPKDLESLLARLLVDGWEPFSPDTPTARDYRRRQGYCLQLRRAGSLPLEVHYRLWGSLPETAARDVLDGSQPLDPSTARSSHHRAVDTTSLRCPHRAHRYLLAALHGWMTPRESPFRWWDLEWILRGTSRSGDLTKVVAQVCDEAVRWQVQLPVSLAALRCRDCFASPEHGRIADQLAPTLRSAERFLLRRYTKPTMSHALIETGRMLARRPSRGGSAAALRKIWPHPHVVQQATPSAWSPWRRRWVVQRRRLAALSRVLQGSL